ncbi:MAG: adenylyltransferase/cytidyltransferase family protein [Euryarchaeota archaeon]|nr:adenylyltransferase/cytidyltransferase family protein [Euryarchaeota archaeon]
MTRVLATGTFDLLHPGHVFFLSQAREMSDELYVLVARDSMIKHKPAPIIPEDQRLEMIRSLAVVDVAALGSERDIFEPLETIRPDIVALGYDQRFDEIKLEGELREHGFNTRVVRVKQSKSCSLCSTGKIIKKVLERYQ